jgi:hypothetical protein
MLSDKMISADPVRVGGLSVWTWPPQEGEMTDHINVKGQSGTFSAYIARPKTSPASAVVVLQELFGVNADIRKHCDELAEQGYLAVAPDAGVKDIKGTIDAVRNLPECNGKVALLGYCLGALMVFMTAVRNDGFMRPFSCIWPRRVSSFPRPHKRRLKQHLLRSQMRRCTATLGRVTHSPAITENTTTPPRLTLPTVGRANSSIASCDDCRKFLRSNRKGPE